MACVITFNNNARWSYNEYKDENVRLHTFKKIIKYSAKGLGGQKRKLSSPLKKYNYITNSKEEWRDGVGQGEHK